MAKTFLEVVVLVYSLDGLNHVSIVTCECYLRGWDAAKIYYLCT